MTYSFTSSLDTPDGRHVYVSVEIPDDHPATENPAELMEHTEIAQIGAASVLRNLLRADQSRAKRAAEGREVVF